MGLFLILLLVFFFFLFLFLFVFLRIEIFFKRDAENDQGTITFSLFRGLVNYCIDINKIQLKGIKEGVEIKAETKTEEYEKQVLKESIEKVKHNYQEILEQVAHFQKIIYWFLSKVICDRFSWVTKIGTGEAHETGVVVGIAWGIKTSLVGFLGRNIQWKDMPEVDILPCFQQMCLESQFHLIIRFRIGNAIKGVFRLIIQLMKERGYRWRNILSRA